MSTANAIYFIVIALVFNTYDKEVTKETVIGIAIAGCNRDSERIQIRTRHIEFVNNSGNVNTRANVCVWMRVRTPYRFSCTDIMLFGLAVLLFCEIVLMSSENPFLALFPLNKLFFLNCNISFVSIAEEQQEKQR